MPAKLTEEARAKISASLRGNKNALGHTKGHPFSAESRAKIAAATSRWTRQRSMYSHPPIEEILPLYEIGLSRQEIAERLGTYYSFVANALSTSGYPSRRNRVTREKTAWNSHSAVALARYRDQFAAQQGLCAICGRPETIVGRTGKPMALARDHNHRTGILRALLCHACNRMIGMADENPGILEAGATYLRIWAG